VIKRKNKRTIIFSHGSKVIIKFISPTKPPERSTMTEEEKYDFFYQIRKMEKKMDEEENKMDENMKGMENNMDENMKQMENNMENKTLEL